ncbi:MAG: hypothetical protein WD404_07355 [Solirubrobacterales bacterium]
MRRLPLAAIAALIALAGCGDQGDSTPVACLGGELVYLDALEAPGAVELDGAVPISECLSENQSGGDLAAVGVAMVTAATRLNSGAREDPGGGANLRLGYLVGAAERGAAGTEGIHADLLRRLQAAARYSPGGDPLPPAFDRAYRSGYAAGQNRG